MPTIEYSRYGFAGSFGGPSRWLKFSVRDFAQEDPHLTAHIDLLIEPLLNLDSKEVKALVQSLKDAASKILRLNPDIPQEAQMALDNIQSTSFLIHFLHNPATDLTL